MSQEPCGQVGSSGLRLKQWLMPCCEQSSAVLHCVHLDMAELLSADHRIIGKGGETVRALQSYSGAMIQVAAG